MKLIFFPVIFAFTLQCGINSETKKGIEAVLNENQKVSAYLLAHDKELPDLKGMISVLASSRTSIKEKDIQNKFSEMETILSKVNGKEREEFMIAYSGFSEILAGLVKKAGFAQQYNRFYCPMVRKTWVAKGEEIQNPYAPEMRDCGDLIK
ncbi:MAG: hypothetical protein K8R21_05435 [Leptospira sp.]|nr:hypothetical protein [Leptospira sp.]